MGFDWKLQPEHCSPPVPPAGLDSCPAPTSKDGQLQREAFWPIRDCKTCLWHDFGSKHKFEGRKLAPGDHCHFLNQVLMKAKVVCRTQVVWFVFQHVQASLPNVLGMNWSTILGIKASKKVLVMVLHCSPGRNVIAVRKRFPEYVDKVRDEWHVIGRI